MNRKLATLFGLAVAAVGLLVVWRATMKSNTEQERYRDLCRFGSLYEAAWTGKLRLPDRLAAALHFTSPTDYYRSRMEAESKALLASGYFVETSVPVPNLRAKMALVVTTLKQTGQATGAYYEAKLNWPGDEVRLVCRKQDVPLWETALRKGMPH